MSDKFKVMKTFINFEAQKLDKKNITTQALGEEGGATTDSIFDAAKEKDVQPKYTTMAVGEEGGDNAQQEKYTTMAVGEEGGN